MAIGKRPFGSTGQMSTEVIFGGAALSKATQDTADKALDLLLEYGINHIDTAADYGNSETLIGPWMDRHRQDFFLASKTGARDYAGARESIHRSLDRLHTDRLDLLQIHALYHPDEWEQALSPGGALDAVVEAREEGLVRFIGITGHGWTVAATHRRALDRFAFDSVLMPWNWVAAHHPQYGPDFLETEKICTERGIAVQTIKSCARGSWAAGATKTHTTWYEPLTTQEDIGLAVSWVLGRPGIFLATSSDVDILAMVLRAAATREGMPDDTVMSEFAERVGLNSVFGL